jgi:CO/xanthine dehydrogenase Mo-binding subunit
MQEKVSKDAGPAGYTYVGTRPVRPDGVDKVTGRARFGADYNMAGQLVGKVLRSPHPHARLKRIDTSAAASLPGVKAIVTRDDFLDQASEFVPAGEMLINYRDVVRNVMAREKVLYEGHAVAAVAATTAAIAKEALRRIAVEYEVLPHVMDVNEATAAGAPLLHEDMITAGVQPAPSAPSNVAKRVEFILGDVGKGFAAADVVLEREYVTKPVHQGYIEPHACLANVAEDGQAELWVTTQGHWIVRAHCARLLGWDIQKLRVTATEIGGGFGGKTVVYLEPVALALSAKARRPVKMAMTREEVFRASGPTSGARVWVKIGARKDGRITAAEAVLKYQAGAFQGSPVMPGAMCAFAPYDLEHVKVVGYDIVSNRPKVAAYRAPGGPISEYAVESLVDELARKLEMDPIELRLKNAAKEGTKTAYGPKVGPVGLVESLEAARAHAHWKAPLKACQGRGIAAGFWFNIGGETTVSLALNEDGTLNLTAGTPDIGGLRASLCMMAAEELGIDYGSIRPLIADTASLGYNFLTGGSRSTFSSGMATVEAARSVIKQACARAAKLWEVPEDAVTYRNGTVMPAEVETYQDGTVVPAGAKPNRQTPMTLADIGRIAGKTGGPIVATSSINAHGAAPSFGVHLADVEVDPETGKVSIVRYTVIQDAGRAIHPSYVEGQYQGGAAQGIGWALNEEYVYGADGRLQNPGFLDYRVPVASDLPMIDTVIVEVPNPRHPYGVRGIGETPIVPPMAAIANAVADATGLRLAALPMSPPKVLEAIESARAARDPGLKV